MKGQICNSLITRAVGIAVFEGPCGFMDRIATGGGGGGSGGTIIGESPIDPSGPHKQIGRTVVVICRLSRDCFRSTGGREG